MNNIEKFQRWRNWLESINIQVQTLVLYRRIFTEVDQIVQQNKELDKDNIYFGFVSNAYVDSVVMGIRRQIKSNQSSISLVRLLDDIAKNPQVMSRSLFEQQFMSGVSLKLQQSRSSRSTMDKAFSKFAEPTSQHIDASRVLSDVADLRAICKKAEDYADKRIAHWDIHHPTSNLSFDDINESLDQLCEIVQKYYLLLFGTHMFMKPALPQPISELFQTAWLSEGKE